MYYMRTMCYIVIATIIVIFVPNAVFAVTGTCSSCHTMHNSQDGVEVSYGLDAEDTGPNVGLLISDCVGCHSSSAGNQVLGNTPIVNTTTTIPVFNDTALAGGDFYWVVNSGDNYGHNVDGIVGVDSAVNVGMTPPGWSSAAAFGYAGTDATRRAEAGSWGEQLTCDGVYGCHGDVVDGVWGSHHNNAGGLREFAAVDDEHQGEHYRFLHGINGYEDPKWQHNVADDGNFNVYHGEIRSGSDLVGSRDTISFLCAQCHGNFHSGTGTDEGIADSGFASPWIRHPVDVKLYKLDTEYASYSASTYIYGVPVAFDVTNNVSYDSTDDINDPTDIQIGLATVTCLSCHVAHASPNHDLLRWNYRGWPGNSVENDYGCHTCHSSKN